MLQKRDILFRSISRNGAYDIQPKSPTKMTNLFDDILSIMDKHCSSCEHMPNTTEKSPQCENPSCVHNVRIEEMRKGFAIIKKEKRKK